MHLSCITLACLEGVDGMDAALGARTCHRASHHVEQRLVLAAGPHRLLDYATPDCSGAGRFWSPAAVEFLRVCARTETNKASACAAPHTSGAVGYHMCCICQCASMRGTRRGESMHMAPRASGDCSSTCVAPWAPRHTAGDHRCSKSQQAGIKCALQHRGDARAHTSSRRCEWLNGRQCMGCDECL
jgi:hypothetical protein